MSDQELRLLRLRVTPRAARTEIMKFDGEVLHIRCSAPPVDGAANEACCAVIADALGIAKSRVVVVKGKRSREKTIRVEGFAGPWPWPGSAST